MRHTGHGTIRTTLLLAVLLAVRTASGVELWTSEDLLRTASLDIAFKWSSLLGYAPDDPLLFPERWNAANLFRFRLGLTADPHEKMTTEFAYEHRARLLSENSSLGLGGALPSDAPAPFRLAQLDWSLVDIGSTFSYSHEIDRALAAFHPEWGEVTIGRQAIGLGRGVLFSAVDIFSPFSPLEVDREWRRGVDALRAEYRFSDAFSAEMVGAFGETWEDSALIGRLRGYKGNVDGEIICGKRGEDMMYALTMSSTVGEGAMHLELAMFDVPEIWPDGGLFGDSHLIGKAVIGGSYTFNVRDEPLTVFLEYHYSGFGIRDITTAITRLSDPAYLARYLRGDTQILGRHAIGLSASYPLNDVWTANLLWLQSPVDGSGVVSPGLSWDFAQNVSLVFSAFFPYGAPPSGGQLNSEYGASPLSLFLQLSMDY